MTSSCISKHSYKRTQRYDSSFFFLLSFLKFGYICFPGFPGCTVVKNLPANTGDSGDLGSTPGLEDPLEEEMGTGSSIPAWKILWTEEPGRLLSMQSPRAGHDWAVKHAHMHRCFAMLWISYIHTYIPPLVALPPTRLGDHRAPFWVPRAMQQVPH